MQRNAQVKPALCEHLSETNLARAQLTLVSVDGVIITACSSGESGFPSSFSNQGLHCGLCVTAHASQAQVLLLQGGTGDLM